MKPLLFLSSSFLKVTICGLLFRFGIKIGLFPMKHFYLTFLGLFLSLLLPITVSGKEVNQSDEKSSIKITAPNSATVWIVSKGAELKWNTVNIPEDKTLQFYLFRDELVVQELGIFKNKKFIENISLNRSLAAGNNYRVIAIELFPKNKLSIAKFATPLFTIKKDAPRNNPIQSTATKTKSSEAVSAAPSLRDSFDGRKINYVDELSVSSEAINIMLWDHGRVDGDIVSIYLNGEAIVSKYALTYQKKKFSIQLDKSKKNDLFLYAHNLGKSPPNTVSIEISDGSSSKNIILNSDLKSCEAVTIKVEN